jgi:hypothetical protein
MAIKKQTAKPANESNTWLSTESPDDLGPANRIAHDILSGRRDLSPSVQRIMTAGLGEEVKAASPSACSAIPPAT